MCLAYFNPKLEKKFFYVYARKKMSSLNQEIKELIINSLSLEDITAADIDDHAPLFGDEGLGLDSVDALELGLAVQKHFGFQLDKENQSWRPYFENVASLSELIGKMKG